MNYSWTLQAAKKCGCKVARDKQFKASNLPIVEAQNLHAARLSNLRKAAKIICGDVTVVLRMLLTRRPCR